MSLKYSFKMSGKDIDKAVSLLAKRGKALEQDIHKVAVSCLVQIAEHRNTTKLRMLYAAMKGSAVRAEAIKAWACHYGGVTFDREAEDKATGETGTFVLVKTREVQVEASKEKTPFSFKAEPEFKPFDLDAALKRIVGQARKRVENPDDRDTIDLEHLQGIEHMLGIGPAAKTENDTVDATEKAEIKKALAQNKKPVAVAA